MNFMYSWRGHGERRRGEGGPVPGHRPHQPLLRPQRGLVLGQGQHQEETSQGRHQVSKKLSEKKCFTVFLDRIEAGEEVCTNYIDDFHTNYNTREARHKVLSGWGFRCGCWVCSLPEEKLKVNNEMRR